MGPKDLVEACGVQHTVHLNRDFPEQIYRAVE